MNGRSSCGNIITTSTRCRILRRPMTCYIGLSTTYRIQCHSTNKEIAIANAKPMQELLAKSGDVLNRVILEKLQEAVGRFKIRQLAREGHALTV